MDETEITYNVEPQDFTPFMGEVFYRKRNWKHKDGEPLTPPEPYGKYLATSLGLTLFNFSTGSALVISALYGLETLLK